MADSFLADYFLPSIFVGFLYKGMSVSTLLVLNQRLTLFLAIVFREHLHPVVVWGLSWWCLWIFSISLVFVFTGLQLDWDQVCGSCNICQLGFLSLQLALSISTSTGFSFRGFGDGSKSSCCRHNLVGLFFCTQSLFFYRISCPIFTDLLLLV